VGLLTIILAAAVLMGASGALCLALPRRAGHRDKLFAILMVLGGGVGTLSVLWSLVTGAEAAYESAWLLPIGRLALRLDMLSAVFLVPVFLVPALGAVFGTAYWREQDNPATAPRLRVFYGLMPASMAGVILAQNGVLLLVAWEVMALSAFFAIAAEDMKREVREAAWVYFVATHVGTLSLLGFFTLLSSATGSFELVPLRPGMGAGGETSWLFVLGLVGFGLKAGVMPLHVWLPGAHANAPSHVSAVLSGVMLKVGVYGVVRMCWLLPPGPLWWSWVLIGVGACAAVLGIAYALGQRDYKRLLAYSSIENIGVIVLAIGVAMLGRTTGSATLAVFGLAGALLHVWNHSLFKSLLFLVSGALLHACGTRRMNALGGLEKRMPRTAAAAAIACLAIAALPPLNGFVSEWLIYRGVIGDLARGPTGPSVPLALAIVAIALTGALALATFVKFFGTLFLGQERSDAVVHAHDPPPAMLAPMGVLVFLCLVIGLLPRVALAPIARAVQLWTGDTHVGAGELIAAAGLLATVSVVSAATVGVAIILVLGLRARVRHGDSNRSGTWDCGYAVPSARMQYSESSFAELLVGLFEGLLIPRRRRPQLGAQFPGASTYESETPDVVLDRGVRPMLEHATRWVTRLRLVQQGRVQVYVLYILVGLVVLLSLVNH
jgi:hydrogenase-4 component B